MVKGLRHQVSIARRRLVVLRLRSPRLRVVTRWFRFNRPKAISCLATHGGGYWDGVRLLGFQSRDGEGLSCDVLEGNTETGGTYVSIARRRLVVLRPFRYMDVFGRECLVSIARRRLVVLRRHSQRSRRVKGDGFNRPKAISCLATLGRDGDLPGRRRVSIARRRLVVLRLADGSGQPARACWFQSPEGD